MTLSLASLHSPSQPLHCRQAAKMQESGQRKLQRSHCFNHILANVMIHTPTWQTRPSTSQPWPSNDSLGDLWVVRDQGHHQSWLLPKPVSLNISLVKTFFSKIALQSSTTLLKPSRHYLSFHQENRRDWWEPSQFPANLLFPHLSSFFSIKTNKKSLLPPKNYHWTKRWTNFAQGLSTTICTILETSAFIFYHILSSGL